MTKRTPPVCLVKGGGTAGAGRLKDGSSRMGSRLPAQLRADGLHRDVPPHWQGGASQHPWAESWKDQILLLHHCNSPVEFCLLTIS